MNGSSSGLVNGTPGTQGSLEQNELASTVAKNENNIKKDMPHYENAVTPEEKFVKYSLDFSNPNATGKAEAYKRGLGFTQNNASDLIRQIHISVSTGAVKPYDISKSEYGVKYKYRIPVKGANGKIKNVIAVYQIDNGETIPRLITNYLEGK